LLATAGDDNTVRLWDTSRRGTVDRPLTTLIGPVSAVAFSPDGRLLATASDDNTVRLWDTIGRGTVDRPLAALTGHTGPVNAVAFSPDGRLLATASDDNTARLWDVDADRLVTAARATPATNQLTAAGWRRVLPDIPYTPAIYLPRRPTPLLR
jgi:WD40 repeat protein